MSYEKFKQLWNEILEDKIKTHNMSNDTFIALIEYGQGNKTKIESIRKMLDE